MVREEAPLRRTNRDRALDAAVRIVGTGGIHALSHARVDAEASIPRGSTSNHFRTRATLVQGTVDRLVMLEQQSFGGAEPPNGLDGLVEAIVRFTRRAVEGDREVTVARMAFFAESMHDPEIRVALARGRRRIERWAADMLTTSGVPDPEAAVRRALAVCDGVILHSLALDVDEGPQLDLELLVRATMAGPVPPENR